MKTLKLNILQNFILVFCLSVIVVSCSTEDTVEENIDTKTSFNKDAKLIFDVAEDFQTKVRDLSSEEIVATLDQEALNEYLIQYGFDKNAITLKDAEQIIAQIGLAHAKGVDHIINRSRYSETTKNALIVMSRGEYIKDLKTIPNYEKLDTSEKEILSLSNNIAKNYRENYNTTTVDVPCPSSACGVGFAIVGAIAGTAICGLPCGIIGGIFGLIAGTAGK